ncbi:MAG: hypothetical protein ABIL09_02380 [Gemmatimonadota bacterium]
MIQLWRYYRGRVRADVQLFGCFGLGLVFDWYGLWQISLTLGPLQAWLAW